MGRCHVNPVLSPWTVRPSAPSVWDGCTPDDCNVTYCNVMVNQSIAACGTYTLPRRYLLSNNITNRSGTCMILNPGVSWH